MQAAATCAPSSAHCRKRRAAARDSGRAIAASKGSGAFSPIAGTTTQSAGARPKADDTGTVKALLAADSAAQTDDGDLK